jgi:S1-C subfamily serine protease
LGERAGLRSGDIIREVNLKPIRDAEDLERSLAGLAPGSRVTIVFLREGETLRSEIVI